MAEDIKIIGNINNKIILDRYSTQDNNLIPSVNLPENFGGKGDYIEYFIYDKGNNLLYSDYNYSNYKHQNPIYHKLSNLRKIKVLLHDIICH